MKRKTTYILGLTALFSLALCLSFVYASDSYFQIYMVGSSGSTDAKTVFTLDEKPWLYLEFQDPAAALPVLLQGTGTHWTWDNLLGPDVTTELNSLNSGQNSIWIAFNDLHWKDYANEGNWTIIAHSDVNLSNGGTISKSYEGSTSFRIGVVPEPISVLLFLAGAAILVTFRRKSFKA